MGHERLVTENLDARARKLAAAARALKSAGGARAPFHLAFLTDKGRGGDALAVARALAPGTAVILRDYADPDREALARALQEIARARRLVLMIGGDAGLARRIGAAGVHLRRDQLGQPPARHGLILSAACHDAVELERAGAIGADIALLSPAFPTASHRGAPALGPDAFKRLAAAAPLPVLALGGVDERNAMALAGRNVAGFAAIGAFLEKGQVSAFRVPDR